MPIRNTHRVGDYLMLDDESGLVHYASEMREIWDGTYRHKKNFETRQPQEFVYAKDDPKALFTVRPEPLVTSPTNNVSGLIGDTSVTTPTSPAGHLFQGGIGSMVIESPNINARFVIR